MKVSESQDSPSSGCFITASTVPIPAHPCRCEVSQTQHTMDLKFEPQHKSAQCLKHVQSRLLTHLLPALLAEVNRTTCAYPTQNDTLNDTRNHDKLTDDTPPTANPHARIPVNQPPDRQLARPPAILLVVCTRGARLPGARPLLGQRTFVPTCPRELAKHPARRKRCFSNSCVGEFVKAALSAFADFCHIALLCVALLLFMVAWLNFG